MKIIRYSGPYGFIKPFYAVRDELTISQQFVLPSVLRHLEIMMGLPVNSIQRAKLSHQGIDIQQEVTQAASWEIKKKYKPRIRSILKRGVMVEPVLHLLFGDNQIAEKAATCMLCLSRTEDLLYPDEIADVSEDNFNLLPGKEFISKPEKEGGIFCGNYYGLERFGISDGTPMNGIVTSTNIQA
jgi:hypothetical protein